MKSLHNNKTSIDYNPCRVLSRERCTLRNCGALEGRKSFPPLPTGFERGVSARLPEINNREFHREGIMKEKKSLIGQKISLARKSLGLTFDELARESDSSKSYIWELENKFVAYPSADKVLKLSKALGVRMDYLADDTVGLMKTPAKAISTTLKGRDLKMILSLVRRLEAQPAHQPL